MMQRQADRAVNILAMPDVAGQRQGSLGMPHTAAGPFHAGGIARQHHHARALIGKNLSDRFPNSHGGARHHHNFPCKVHSALLFLCNL